MSAYSDRIIPWINNARAGFGKYISRDFPLQMSISSMSDDALELYSWMLEKDIRGKSQRKSNPINGNESRMVYLVPSMGSDGSVTWYDRYSDRVVAGLTPTDNGMPIYFGLLEYMEKFGGRSAYDTFVNRFADAARYKNYYVHDMEKRKAA
jgi:hypothetical protein